MEDGFYRSKDPTNSIKVLKENLQKTNQTTETTQNTHAWTIIEREKDREYIVNDTSAHSRLYSVIHVVYDLHTMDSRQLKMTDDRLQ